MRGGGPPLLVSSQCLHLRLEPPRPLDPSLAGEERLAQPAPMPAGSGGALGCGRRPSPQSSPVPFPRQLGTPSYLSPEACTAGPKETWGGSRCKVWPRRGWGAPEPDGAATVLSRCSTCVGFPRLFVAGLAPPEALRPRVMHRVIARGKRKLQRNAERVGVV